ncbi:BMP family protein [Coleofasciculus sp. H7-2]|uniref:BMP family protein n=1 Tax=Coleofasciculus sp. H7-2 TaxID=3351545 RepID=UPI00366B490F
MTQKIICLVLTLFLVACGATGSKITPTPETGKAGTFKVAMLFPGPVDDKGWNQSGYEGLKLIEKELGAEVAYSASVPEADGEKLFRQYAKKSFDFLISHGDEYRDAAETVAKDFPRAKFAVMSSYAGNNKNVGALAFRSGEVGYLTGVVAGLKTKTKKVAFIGGQAYPVMEEEAILFKRGVLETKLDSTVSIKWVNSWSDADKARKIAQEQVAAGTDVLVVDADRANIGVIIAAQSKGVYVIGWTHAINGMENRHKLAPKTIVTSVVQQVPMLMLEGATLVQQGRWEGKQYKFGLLEEVQDLAPFYGALTPEQEAFVDSVKQDIITGKINVSP